MLSDVQIDRWSRQIVLPHVGGRGQARLLAAVAGLPGHTADGALGETIGDLLARAGVRVVRAGETDGLDVLIDLGADPALAQRALERRIPLVRASLAGAAGDVLTLVGRPCGLCAPPPAPRRGGTTPLAAPAAGAIAAVVAAEVLGVLLEPRPAGRRHELDLEAGVFRAAPLAATGCDRCREACA